MPICRLHEALCDAAAKGDEDACKALIARGASATSADDEGWTALHSAVAGDHPGVCALLISHGADWKAEADVMFVRLTPMQQAVFSGCIAVVDYFLEVHDEDLGQLSRDGSSLDELAHQWMDNEKMVEHLQAVRSKRSAEAIAGSIDNPCDSSDEPCTMRTIGTTTMSL